MIQRKVQRMNAIKTNANYYQAAIGCYFLTSIDAFNINIALRHFLSVLTVDSFTIYRNGKAAWDVKKGIAVPL